MNPPDPRPYAIPAEVLELIPESLVREHCVLPARVDQSTITIYCPDDERFGSEEREKIQFILNRPVDWWPAERDAVREAITKHLGELPVAVIDCDLKFRFRCPLLWEQLRSTGDAHIRFCEVCERSVHRAADASEAQRLARDGKCVAYTSVECDTVGLIEFE